MIAQVEDAMIARIAGAKAAGLLAYDLTVESYGAEWIESLDQVVQRYPAMWVVFAGFPDILDASGAYESTAVYSVIVAAKSYRNEKSTRKGDASIGEVGSYQMIGDAIKLLANQTLGLEIDPLVPKRVQSLFNGVHKKKKLSLFAITFQTAFALDVEDVETPLSDFELGAFDWDMAPTDGQIDAQDLVELEGATP